MSRVRYEILAHALERLEERFPNEYPDTDLEAGQLIQQEVEAGLAQGRWGRVVPDGFCLEGPNRWTDEFVWTPSGRRCYVIQDFGSKVKVITTLERITRPHRLVNPIGQPRLHVDKQRGAAR